MTMILARAMYLAEVSSIKLPSDMPTCHCHLILYRLLEWQDIVSEHPERFFVAEILREKILLHYDQEIPYVAQVCSSIQCTQAIDVALSLVQ